MPADLIDCQSILVQVIAWYHQATGHYLNQCWQRSPTSYGDTRPQGVNQWWQTGVAGKTELTRSPDQHPGPIFHTVSSKLENAAPCTRTMLKTTSKMPRASCVAPIAVKIPFVLCEEYSARFVADDWAWKENGRLLFCLLIKINRWCLVYLCNQISIVILFNVLQTSHLENNNQLEYSILVTTDSL